MEVDSIVNVSDKIADKAVGMTINILRLAEHMQATVLRDLEALETELVVGLQRALSKKATEFTLARLKALLVQTRATIATAYDGIIANTQQEAERLARIVASQTVGIVNGVIGIDFMTVALTPEKLVRIASDSAVFGKLPWQYWKDQDARLRDAFAREMRMGQFRGETIEQLVRRVRGTKAMNWTDGVMNARKIQAQALVRTSVMTVAGETSNEVYSANRDVVRGIQWISTLDSRTTEQCIALDSKQWDFPASGNDYADYIPIGHDKEFDSPPIHWNCRSTTVPITYSWEELAAMHGNSAVAKKVKEIPEGTRASMDGQVAASTTFPKWLEQQSESLQNEILGKGRADLWRAGKITLSSLTDARNNPLTLEQLAAL